MTGLPTLRRFGILVAEDDPVERRLLASHLRHLGLTVHEASDGRQALSIIGDDGAIRLLIMDLWMPDTDGLTLIEQSRAHSDGRLYVIVLSGAPDRHTLMQALEAGACDFLMKPCHPAQILTRLTFVDQLMALEGRYQSLVRDLLEVIGEMLGSRDQTTRKHSHRVAALALRAGERLGLTGEEIAVLEVGCLVHDIGKIAIPDDVLLKPGRFDPLDRRIMEMHPTIGARFLASRYPDEQVTEIVLKHHERLDGTGYPQGLKANEIGPLVRIVAAADVYEALVARRPYKSALRKPEAARILNEEVTQGRLDSDAVRALLNAIETWDPLTIELPPPSYAIEDLETFRRMTYFREPMKSFYNYRYLLAMDIPGEMMRHGDCYHLVLIDYKNLHVFNRRCGYLRADQCLDELGETLDQALKDFGRVRPELGPVPRLFRKGADCLILTFYVGDVLEKLCDILREHLARFKGEWGLEARFLVRRYGAGYPVEQALDQILEAEQEQDHCPSATPPEPCATPLR